MKKPVHIHITDNLVDTRCLYPIDISHKPIIFLNVVIETINPLHDKFRIRRHVEVSHNYSDCLLVLFLAKGPHKLQFHILFSKTVFFFLSKEPLPEIKTVYIALPEMRGLGGDRDLTSGAELGKSMLSLCIRISDLDGISFRRNC